MKRSWSEARHLKLAIKRMNEIKSGKAKTKFLMGPVAEFNAKGITYSLCVHYESIELSAYKENKNIFKSVIKGNKFKKFLEYISDWLSFPQGFVVYMKKNNKYK